MKFCNLSKSRIEDEPLIIARIVAIPALTMLIIERDSEFESGLTDRVYAAVDIIIQIPMLLITSRLHDATEIKYHST